MCIPRTVCMCLVSAHVDIWLMLVLPLTPLTLLQQLGKMGARLCTQLTNFVPHYLYAALPDRSKLFSESGSSRV